MAHAHAHEHDDEHEHEHESESERHRECQRVERPRREETAQDCNHGKNDHGQVSHFADILVDERVYQDLHFAETVNG